MDTKIVLIFLVVMLLLKSGYGGYWDSKFPEKRERKSGMLLNKLLDVISLRNKVRIRSEDEDEENDQDFDDQEINDGIFDYWKGMKKMGE